MLLLDLADRHGDDGKIFPSNATLADENCISEKSIEGLLSRGRKNNLIKTSPARKGQRRYITLLCPVDGQELFLQICKKDFANMQKSLNPTYSSNVKEEKNDVVASLSEYYGLELDNYLVRILTPLQKPKIINIFKHATTKSRPNGFIRRAVEQDYKLPEIEAPYEHEKNRMAQLRREAIEAQNLGFTTSGYTH